MLSREDNELMCRVGAGTAMGTALRRYWLPALQSSDLESGGDPRRVELLSQTFVAFRGTDGRVGILDEFCPHRAASLVLGHVEECGLRCIYHGWKFDADGKVLETPNVAAAKFTQRLKAKAYPAREAGGLIWTYLGPAEKYPPFPAWPWLQVPPRHRLTSVHTVNCNFVQILEGLVDSTHLNVLHTDGLRSSEAKAARTPYGFQYAAIRSSTEGSAEGAHARITAFAAPCIVASAKAAERGQDPIGVGEGIDTSTIQGKTIYLKGSQQWQ